MSLAVQIGGLLLATWEMGESSMRGKEIRKLKQEKRRKTEDRIE